MNTKIIESYIVRIYRRGEEDDNDFVGVIEDTVEEGKRKFHSRDELLDILDRKKSIKPSEAMK